MGNNSIEKGQHVEMLQRMSPENINLCWTLANCQTWCTRSENHKMWIDIIDTCKSRHNYTLKHETLIAQNGTCRLSMDVIQPKTSTPKGAHPGTGKRLWYSRKRAPRKVPTRVFNLPMALFNNFPYHRLHWNLRRPTLFCLASSHHHVQGCGDISRKTNIRIENQIETRPFESIWIVRYLIFSILFQFCSSVLTFFEKFAWLSMSSN